MLGLQAPIWCPACGMILDLSMTLGFRPTHDGGVVAYHVGCLDALLKKKPDETG